MYDRYLIEIKIIRVRISRVFRLLGESIMVYVKMSEYLNIRVSIYGYVYLLLVEWLEDNGVLELEKLFKF